MIELVKHALRSLRARPGASLLAVACLSIGIGANVALFGVVDALLFRPPLGVGDPATLVRVQPGGPASPLMASTGSVSTYPMFETVRDQRKDLVDVAAYGRGPSTLNSGPEARGVGAQSVSSNYFEVMGVRPALGRFFDPAEGEPRAAVPVAVLGYRFWQESFGGRRDVLGTTIRAGDVALTVVGVAPEEFVGADLGQIDLWVPMGMAGTPGFGGGYGRGSGWIQMVGRLRPGLTLVAARARLSPEDDGPEPFSVTPFRPEDAVVTTRPMAISLVPLRTMFFGDTQGEAPVPLWALGISAAVLLLACATVANLLLAQAVRRRRDVAVRLSLGASPGRILATQLAESAILAVGAVAGSAVLAWLAVGLANRLPTPPLGSVLGLRAALFGLGVALATPILFGTAPALWAARRDVGEVLKKTGSTRTPAGLQRGLMAAQTAIAFALLVVAGLFLGSLQRIRNIPLGWDTVHTLAVYVDFPESHSDHRLTGLVARATGDIGKIPGVVAAGAGNLIPFYNHNGVGVLIHDGRSDAEQPQGDMIDLVGPDYFRALDIPVTQGRAFDDADRAGAAPVAMISETFARRFFPGRSPLGACIDVSNSYIRGAFGGACAAIVGVAADAKYDDLIGTSSPILYLATNQVEEWSFTNAFFVRVSGRPEDMLGSVRAAVQNADPSMPFPRIETMRALLDRRLFHWRIAASLFGMLGALAALLAAVGVYGLASFLVEQRSRELGIRSALGAGRDRLIALVLWDGIKISGVGLGVGAAAGLALGRIFASRLYGLSWAHPTTYMTVGAGILLLGVAAGLRPAMRASQGDPSIVLREE